MKHALVFLWLFTTIGTLAQEKLQFVKLAPMLNEAYGFAYAGSSDKLYAVTGGDDAFSYSSFLQIYYTKLDTWTGKKLTNLPLMNFGSSVYMPEYNGMLLLGGTQPYGSSIILNDKIRMLNLDDNAVLELGKLPIPARNIGLAREGRKVYIFGGSVQATPRFICSDKFFSYDLSNGELTQLPDMPKPMETNGAVIDNKLYVFGGYDENALTGVYQYDLVAKAWKTLPSLETPLSSYALVQYEHYIMMIGDFLKTNQLLVYDTKTDKRHYLKMNLDGRFLGAAIVQEELYIFGGLVPNVNGYVKEETYKIAIQDILAQLKP